MSRAVAALALVLGVLAAIATPAAGQAEPDPTVRLVTQSAWVSDEGSFDLVLDVDDVEDDAELDLAVTVHGVLRSRSAFVQSLDGRARGTTLRLRTPLDEVATDTNGNHRVSLPLGGAPPNGLPARLRQGVYPVSVALRGSDGDTVDRFMTHLVRLPADAALTPLSVAWIQPVSAPPTLGEDRALAPDDRAGVLTVLQALTATPNLDLTIEATPETVEALDEDETAPLREAVDAGAQLLATPYVDVDPSALLDAGLGDDLARHRQVGEDVLFATLGSRGDPRTWSAERGLTADAVARLRSLGVTQLVVPERSLEPLDDDITGGTTLTRPFDLAADDDEALRAAAVDPGLRDHFRNGDGQVLRAHQLLADLAVLFFDSPGTTRGVAVRPPDRWRPSGAFLGTVLRAIADVPILRPVTLERLFDTVDPIEDGGATVVRETAPARRVGLPANRLAEAHDAVEQLASLTGPREDVVERARTRILVAESARLSLGDRARVLDAVVSARDDVERRVQLADRRTFRLTAREGTIPLTVVNDNPFPVEIELVLSSDKLEFTDVETGNRSRATRRLVLRPGTHTETVPVRVRASGTFQVRAQLLTPRGDAFRRGQFTITSSAFSGVGVILSIGAGLFLLLWWASHWRTVRRDRRLVKTPQLG